MSADNVNVTNPMKPLRSLTLIKPCDALSNRPQLFVRCLLFFSLFRGRDPRFSAI